MITATKKQHYLIGMFVLLCIVAACSKKDKNTPIDADLKKYFSYKPGTYWIYRDSVTGQIDSFAVISNTYSTSYSTYENYDEEVDNIAAFHNGIVNDSIYYQWTLIKNGVGIIYDYYPAGMGYPLFIYPFQQGYSPNITNGYIVNNVFATFSLYGNTFNTVAVIDETGNDYNSGILQNYEDIYYITTDAGIIKMSFNHSNLQKVWELQRYKIVH